MTLTSHGHHIPGTTHDDEQRHPMVHRCGGPNLCDTCGMEATKHWHPSNQNNRTRVSENNAPKGVRQELEILMSDLNVAEGAGNELRIEELKERLSDILDKENPCPTCSGPIRQTVGMKCPDCGTDYS